MKILSNFLRPFFNDLLHGNVVTYFFLLLYVYYILNLLTSPLNSGMSGGLEAEHNPINQLLGGLFVAYVLFCDILFRSKMRLAAVFVIVIFLTYIAIRTYIGYVLDYGHHSILSMTSIVGYCYWGAGFVFCTNFFKNVSKESLERFIQILIIVFLIFVTYRLITQKAILEELGIPAGINQASHTFFLVPLIVLTFKGKQRLFLLLFCGFVCVYSAKRLAAVGFLIATFFSFKMIYQSYVHKHKIIFLFVVLSFYYIGYSYFEQMSRDLIYRQQRLEMRDEEDSGRFDLWKIAINGFHNTSQNTQLWGGGPGTGTRYIAQYYGIARAPHNGFVQVMCDFGYIGLFLYIGFFVALLIYTVKIKGIDNKLLYLSICFSWIFVNTISHPTSPRCILLGIGIGYIHVLQKYEKNKFNR